MIETPIATDLTEGVEFFIQVYSKLNPSNLASLRTLYTEDVVFEDPAHRIEGIDNLCAYFQSLYSNVNHCHFEIKNTSSTDSHAFVRWQMHLSHPKLSGGMTQTTQGCSYLEFEKGKVNLHRDYFDMGEMLYEGLPVLGKVIRLIKKQLG